MTEALPSDRSGQPRSGQPRSGQPRSGQPRSGQPCEPDTQALPVLRPHSLPAPSEAERHEKHLDRLLARLPGGVAATVAWLRRPSSAWLRWPAGLLLVGGGLLSILPFLGLWMLPLGLMLLAEDVGWLRRLRGRLLDAVARHRPHWLAPHGPAHRAE